MNLNYYHYAWADLLILGVFLVPIIIFDIRQQRIPDSFVFPGLGILFLKRLFSDPSALPVILIDTSAAFMIVALLWFLTRGKIGLGDAKLSAFIAMAIGLFGWFVALFAASFCGLAFALGLVKLKKLKFDDPVPFAPFLGVGCIVSVLLQGSIFTFITGTAA
jgi:prepilin signal peptidase PulO-like enzyme (type II secretory pathway)